MRTLGRPDARTLGRPDARGRTDVRTPGRSDAFLPLIFNFCVRRGGGPKPGRAVTSRAAPAPAATNAKIAKNERKERTIMKSTMYEKYGNVTLGPIDEFPRSGQQIEPVWELALSASIPH